MNLLQEEVFPANTPKIDIIVFNHFKISNDEPEQKLSQSMNETVPHIKIKIMEKY